MEKKHNQDRGKGGPNSAEQRFAPGGESSPPASPPLPSSMRPTKPDHTRAKTDLKGFLYLFLAFLDILFSLGRDGEP